MVTQDEKTSNGQESNNAKKLEERKSEATSDKTLSELEETETVSSSTDTDGFDPGPSPDGALDERDEIKDAGPI
jgi:hypothetical protein